MHTTPVSLLERLRKQPTEAEWGRFVDLYTPLLTYWARRLESQESDASDVVQEVFVTLIRELPRFTYQPDKRFRGWLWTVTVNKWRELKRRSANSPAQPEDFQLNQVVENASDLMDEAEYNNYLTSRALELMQSNLDSNTWRACWECVVQGRPVNRVAAELGMSPNAVRLAKSRVLRQVRRDLEGFLE